MSPAVLLKVKWAVRSVTMATMRIMAAEALRCESPDEIQRLLGAIRGDIGLEALSSGHADDVTQGHRRYPAICRAS